jgi:HlyD family secretion protein
MMKARTAWTLGGAAALAAALLAWAFAPRPVEVEVAQAVRGRFEATIDEDGKTRLRERYVVSAPLAGSLQRIALREGDWVQAQAVVATLTPALAPLLDERTLRELRARLEVTQAQVLRVDARAERARVGVEQARNELQRTEALSRQGFVSPTKLDTDRLSALAAQKELDAAQQERHIAAHEVEQAQAALGAARRGGIGGGGFALHAPISGRVLRVLQTSEATVALGTPLIELGDTAQLEVVAELLTTDALKARPGSRVLIERWGGSGTLQGQVRLVEPAAFTKVSALGVEEQRVEVLIDLASPPEQWRALGDGYRVGVRIVTVAEADVLKVPVSAVFPVPAAQPGGPGTMAVYALRDGRAVQVTVQVGARNGSEAWIRQGLAEGETVIVYPGAAVKDGARVRARSV